MGGVAETFRILIGVSRAKSSKNSTIQLNLRRKTSIHKQRKLKIVDSSQKKDNLRDNKKKKKSPTRTPSVLKISLVTCERDEAGPC